MYKMIYVKIHYKLHFRVVVVYWMMVYFPETAVLSHKTEGGANSFYERIA